MLIKNALIEIKKAQRAEVKEEILCAHAHVQKCRRCQTDIFIHFLEVLDGRKDSLIQDPTVKYPGL